MGPISTWKNPLARRLALVLLGGPFVVALTPLFAAISIGGCIGCAVAGAVKGVRDFMRCVRPISEYASIWAALATAWRGEAA